MIIRRLPGAALTPHPVSTASASIFGGRSEALEARGSFGEANPLSLVYNGQANTLTVSLLNHGKSALSIDAISGAVREVGGKERHLANTTTAKYSLVLPPHSVTPVDVPYRFYSELKPQDVGFVVYVDYSDAADPKKTQLRTIAYDGSATIREPVGSWFDLQLCVSCSAYLGKLVNLADYPVPGNHLCSLLVYPLLALLLAGPVYLVYSTFIAPMLFPKSKDSAAGRKKRRASTAVVATSPTPRPSTPSDPNANADDWIPAHHLQKRRTVSGKNLVAMGRGGVTPLGATSDEGSGNESANAARRSGRNAKGKGKAQ